MQIFLLNFIFGWTEKPQRELQQSYRKKKKMTGLSFRKFKTAARIRHFRLSLHTFLRGVNSI